MSPPPVVAALLLISLASARALPALPVTVDVIHHGVPATGHDGPQVEDPSLTGPTYQVGPSDSAPSETSNNEGLFPLSVIHLNDFHARFEPIDPSGGACNSEAGAACVGGIARVVAEARRLLADRPNPLLLNAGDNFQGTLWYTVYGWEVTAAFLNRLPWDAYVLGNHEFDRKLVGVVPFIQALNAPVVVANMDASREPSMQGLYNKSTVVERGGRKIGIIGIIASNTKELSSPEQLEFTAEAPAVAAEGAALRAAGVDIVVVLSHSGIEVDLALAASDPNVDLVVGGHSHTLLYTGAPPDGDGAYDVYPIVVTQPSGRKVAVVQAGAYTRYLGNLTAFFDDKGELVSAVGNPIYLDKNVEQDAETAAALQPFAQGLLELAARPFGVSAVLLEQNGGQCGAGECNLGSFVADAMAHSFAGRDAARGAWTRAAVAFTNSGGLRAPIQPGNVTYNDVLTTLPFENTIDRVELRGASIRKALLQAVATPRRRGPRAGPWQRNYFGLLQFSGLHVTYEKADSGVTLKSVLVLCHECLVPSYEPLDDEKWYPVSVNRFLGDGGDGYYVFKDEGRNYEKGLLDTDVVLEYFNVQNPVIQGRDGRMIFVEKAAEEDDNRVVGKTLYTPSNSLSGAECVGNKVTLLVTTVMVLRWLGE